MNFLRAQCRPGGRKLACQNQLDLFSRFDRTPTCDGETDTASTSVSTASRGLTCLGWRRALPTELVSSSVFTCIAALGTTPSRTGPLARKYLPGFPYSDLCNGNKTISCKTFTSPQPVGASQKEKNPGALGTCPVCPLVKTACTLIGLLLMLVLLMLLMLLMQVQLGLQEDG